MTDGRLSPEGLEAFIADLRAAGYAADPSQLAAANYLALLAASGTWPGAEARLGNLLSPVFARTPGEQADIVRRVEAWRPLLFLQPGSTTIPPHLHRRGARSARP